MRLGRKPFALLLAVALVSGPVSASFLDSIASGVSSAADAVSSGVGTAVNATSDGLNTAINATGNFVDTAVGGVKDAYNVSRNAITNFTSSVVDFVSPAASNVSNAVTDLGSSVYNVSTGTYQGVVNFGRNLTTSGSANSSTIGNTTVDASNATSIIRAIVTNTTGGFIPVANSILVGLGQNQSASIQAGISDIVNNATGNTSYPASGPNSTVSLGLAQAVITALVTANNYTVTVANDGSNNTINATQVADVFLAGLQDGLTPCARSVAATTNATSGSEEYFSTIAGDCCFLVSDTLTYATALSQANGVGGIFQNELERSQTLGQAPSLDLRRCLANSTATA